MSIAYPHRDGRTDYQVAVSGLYGALYLSGSIVMLAVIAWLAMGGK